MTLPALAPWEEVHRRLHIVFPEGTPHRATSVWPIAAKTVFVMLYVGAVEGFGNWMRPDQVTRMTDAQANATSDRDRGAWAKQSVAPSKVDVPGRWYAVNTRESIRDDTIRNGLIQNGAVVERTGLATTSPAGKYALQAAFAELFDPALDNDAFEASAAQWRETYLTAGARMAIAVLRRGAGIESDRILITFPNGETRRMSPGPSSELSKHVIEQFAPRFLKAPAVVFLSESRDKVVERDEALAKKIGLNILADKNLPDIIFADLSPTPELVFVEVVATDGPVNEARKAALLKLTSAAGFPNKHVRFVTAYMARSSSVFKKTVETLAWGTQVWFAAEPFYILTLDDQGRSLSTESGT